MGMNPGLDMCDPYKQRSFTSDCIYHLKWVCVVICIVPVAICMVPFITIQSMFARKSK